jgi:hypothetical protein
MGMRKATFLAPLAIAATALPAVWGVSASATGTSTGAIIHLYQVDDKISDTSGPVTLTGAVGAYGTDTQGLIVEGTETNVLTFPDLGPHGSSLALDLTTFGTQESMSVNPSTCSFTTVITGSIPIIAASPDDTGIFTAASGTFQVTGTFAGVVPRQPGSCDFSQAGNTQTGLFFVDATGSIFGIRGGSTGNG